MRTNEPRVCAGQARPFAKIVRFSFLRIGHTSQTYAVRFWSFTLVTCTISPQKDNRLALRRSCSSVTGGGTARLQSSAAVKIQVDFLWVVVTCSVVVGYKRFGGPCCFHLQVVVPCRIAVGLQRFGWPCCLLLHGGALLTVVMPISFLSLSLLVYCIRRVPGSCLGWVTDSPGGSFYGFIHFLQTNAAIKPLNRPRSPPSKSLSTDRSK
jgi:hypothetical protein